MNDELRARVAEREEVLGEIKRILISTLHVAREPAEIDPDTPLFGTGLRLDSIDAVELWISVCETFKFRRPEDDRRFTSMRTVNTLAELVLSMKQERAA